MQRKKPTAGKAPPSAFACKRSGIAHRYSVAAWGLAFALITLPAQEVAAQRTEDNPTTQSGDAFGRQVGAERTGLYSNSDVRGFNPLDAGNARVEGLYYDQLDGLPGSIVDGSTIRVGLSSQGFSFPAPTGLVDYEIMRSGSELQGQLTLGYGAYDSKYINGEFSAPIVDGLSLAGGFEAQHREWHDGGHARTLNFGLVAEWRPYSAASITLLGGGAIDRDGDSGPRFYTSGDFLPPKIKRGRDLGLPWTRADKDSSIFGLIAKLPFADYRFEFGAFRSRRVTDAFSDSMFGVDENGHVTQRVIITDFDRPSSSESGEARLVRELRGWGAHHRFTASARLRHNYREFGGAQRFDLGESTMLERDIRPEPEFSMGPRNTDRVRQLTYGLAYHAVAGDLGMLDFGISKSDYSKTVIFADPLVAGVETVESPILWNASASLRVASGLTAYAGMSRGLEDASIAPDRAVNHAVAPPAIHTRQDDVGLRWQVRNGLAVVLGAFQITKPYYNLDAGDMYRYLGEVTISGLEMSLAGEIRPGLSMVAGTVLLNPEIGGEVVESGQLGIRPVGSIRRKSLLNLDWRDNKGSGDWSFDVAIEGNSRRVINSANTSTLPASVNVDLGARYRFAALGTAMVLRPRVLNLLNAYDWRVSSSGAFIYNDRRRFSVEVRADF